MLAHDTSQTLHIPVIFQVSGYERRLSPEVELAFYRIGQEGLNNVARHAQASHADLRLAFDAHATTLSIHDDGRGFTVPDSPAVMADNGHFGLLGIQERAELMGARLLIESATGEGTTLTVSLPEGN
jgi:signal transduction histidine kinase